MSILLTGSSGTIGTRLFERLTSSGYEVVGVDKRANTWNTHLNRRTVKSDLLNPSSLRRLPQDIDLIVHLAANARVYELVKSPEMAMDNIAMTFNILEFARKSKARKIIFSSSREVYGNLTEKESVKEHDAKFERCESPYAASKIGSEALFHSYERVYGIDCVILRFSNVYGMYDSSDRVVPLWIRQALGNEDLIVFGENKSLDFTYIDDTIDGVAGVIERFKRIKGETFNIASGRGVKLSYVANKIKELLGSQSRIVMKHNRPGEVWRFTADISNAQTRLQYKPKVFINEGLSRTIQWYKDFYQAK